jgi:hypothetical protein
MAAGNEPLPPSTSLRQSVVGAENITIGTVGAGAVVNIRADDEQVTDALALLQRARVAFHSKRYDEALGQAAAAAEAFRRLGHADELELARLTVAYTAVECYRRKRDRKLLEQYAVPNLQELNSDWTGVPAARAQRGECLAYLAWCQYWLTNNEYIVQPLVDEAVELLGAQAPMAAWARRALTSTKVESNVKLGAGIVVVYTAWIFVVLGAVALLGWLIG